MKTLIILGVVGLLILGVYFFIQLNNNGEVIMEEKKIYQGPVRPTDDEAYFRKTGITKPLELEE
jgi:hypothetical protein